MQCYLVIKIPNLWYRQAHIRTELRNRKFRLLILHNLLRQEIDIILDRDSSIKEAANH